MKIRNNRIPYYMFPAWINGKATQGQLNAFIELDVELISDMGDRSLMSFIDDHGNHWTIEWMKECFDVFAG